jgi:tetratricopeptide (TPR) repeat protein
VETGAALYADGDYWRAVEESEKALEIDPENFNANNNAGLAHLELGEFRKADMHLRQALRADPSAENVRQNLARLGPMLKKTEPSDKLPADPVGEIVDPAQKASALGAAGRIHLARGAHERAIEMFSRALQFVPGDAPSIIGLGRSYFGLSEYEMAREQFLLAARLDPDDEEAKGFVANTEYALYGNIADGPDRRSQGLSKIEARACVVRGVWLSRQGKFAEAKAEYLRAIDFSPALIEAHNNLAYAHQKLGELEQARAALKKARLLDPENKVGVRNPYGIESATGTTKGILDEAPLEIFIPGSKSEEEPAPAPSSDSPEREAGADSNVPPESSDRTEAPHPVE